MNSVNTELRRIMMDGGWHTTDYLAATAGRQLRPEIVWRLAQRTRKSDGAARVDMVVSILGRWRRAGDVERQVIRLNGRKATLWRCIRRVCFICGQTALPGRMVCSDSCLAEMRRRVARENMGPRGRFTTKESTGGATTGNNGAEHDGDVDGGNHERR